MADDLTEALIRGTLSIGQHGIAEPPRPWRELGYVGDDEAWRPLRPIRNDGPPAEQRPYPGPIANARVFPNHVFRVGAEWPRAATIAPHEDTIDRIEVGPDVERIEIRAAEGDHQVRQFAPRAQAQRAWVASDSPLERLLPPRIVEALTRTTRWGIEDRGDDWYKVWGWEGDGNETVFSFFIRIQLYGAQQEGVLQHGTP